MRMPSRFWLAFGLSAVMLALPACKKARDAATEAAIERATGVDAKVEDGAMTIKTEQGEARFKLADEDGEVSLPAGFPTDIHLPEPRRVISAMDMAGTLMVNLSIRETVATVYASTEKAMLADGWKREMAMQAEDGSTLMFSKDKRQVIYQILADDQGGSLLAIRTGNGEGASLQ